MLKQVCLLALLIAAVHAHAYTLLDPEQIHDTRPRWGRSSGMPGTPEFELFYMLQWRPDRSMEVQFINTSARDMHFNFQFERLQPARDGLNARVHIPAGKSLNVPLKIARLDQRAWTCPLKLWNFCYGDDAMASLPLEKNRPVTLDHEFEALAVTDKSEQAFYSYPTKDSIGYNPQMLPYFIMKKTADTAEVHFRNLANCTIHFDFRVMHYQDGTEIKNPRVSLRPTEDKEVVIPCPTMDGHINYGMVEVFNIRAGEDSGPYVVSYGDGKASERLVKPHNMNFLGADVFAYNFNPWALGQFAERQDGKLTAIRFQNIGDRTVHFDFTLPQFQEILQGKVQRISVEAGKETRVPLDLPDDAHRMIMPIIQNVRVDADSGAFAGAPSNELIPKYKSRDGWLFSTTSEDLLAYNPRSVEYQIRPTAEGADVTLRNLTDKTLYFDWCIGGYQNEREPSNSRVQLPPAAEIVVKAKLEKTGARVAVARLILSNIRIDKDEGSLIAERK